MMITAQVGLLALATVASVLFVLVYGLTSQWWRNPIGQFLVAQGVVISLLYVSSLVRVAVHGWHPLVPVTPGTLIVTAVAALLEVAGVLAFGTVIRQSRRLTPLVATTDKQLRDRITAALAAAADITEDNEITGHTDRLADAVIAALAG